MTIRFLFAYAVGMGGFHAQHIRRQIFDYTIACKRCGEHIPAPVKTMPDDWFIQTCPLCGERRKYLPAEVFKGALSHKLENVPMRKRYWLT